MPFGPFEFGKQISMGSLNQAANSAKQAANLNTGDGLDTFRTPGGNTSLRPSTTPDFWIKITGRVYYEAHGSGSEGSDGPNTGCLYSWTRLDDFLTPCTPPEMPSAGCGFVDQCPAKEISGHTGVPTGAISRGYVSGGGTHLTFLYSVPQLDQSDDGSGSGQPNCLLVSELIRCTEDGTEIQDQCITVQDANGNIVARLVLETA